MNKLRTTFVLLSVLMLSVSLVTSAAAVEETGVYGWIVQFNSAVFGITGAQVADSLSGSEEVPESPAAGSGGGGGGGIAGPEIPAFPIDTIIVDGSIVTDTLQEGQTKIYQIYGIDYDVSLDFVGSTTAKFTVNDETTDLISEGYAYILGDSAVLNIITVSYKDSGVGISTVEFSFKVPSLECGEENKDCCDGSQCNPGLTCLETKVGYTVISEVCKPSEAEPEPVVCTDSDGGKNIYVKGTASGPEWGTDNYVTKTDYCITEGEKAGRLAEFHCSAANDKLMVSSTSYGPEDGCAECVDGACLSVQEEGITYDYLNLYPQEYLIVQEECEYPGTCNHFWADVSVRNMLSYALHNVVITMSIPQLSLSDSYSIEELPPNYGIAPDQFDIKIPTTVESGEYAVVFTITYLSNGEPSQLTKTFARHIAPLSDVKCDDEDGLDYYTKSGLTLTLPTYSSTMEDSCCVQCMTAPSESGPYVSEYVCDGNSIDRDIFKCPTGCSDGACLGLSESTGIAWSGFEWKPIEVAYSNLKGFGNWHVSGSSLKQDEISSLHYKIIALASNGDNYEVTAQLRFEKGTEAGICARMDGNGNGYCFATSWGGTDNTMLARFINNDQNPAHIRQGKAFPISTNVPYNVKIAVLGTSIKGKIWEAGSSEPSEWVAEGYGTRFSKGNVGFYTYGSSVSITDLSIMAIEEPLPVCTDSDGGKNYYVKGVITGPLASHPDSPREDVCVDGSLREMFCNEDGLGEPVSYDCPNGCSDGACLPVPEEPEPTIGEAWLVQTPSENLSISEILKNGDVKRHSIGDVKNSVGEKELQILLNDGTFRNKYGDFYYNQYLYFDAPYGYVAFMENPDADVVDSYLYFKNANNVSRYLLRFSNMMAVSAVASDFESLRDFEGHAITMLGKEYRIVSAKTDFKGLTLVMFSGSVMDVLNENETKTYAVDGTDYKVTLDLVGSATAKFTVNGEPTDSLQKGDIYRLSDGPYISVGSIAAEEFAGGVRKAEFYLGASKLMLKDIDIKDDVSSSKLTVNDEVIDDTSIKLKGGFTIPKDKSISDLLLTSIELNIVADDDLYIPQYGKLSNELEEPQGLLESWDIRYMGLNQQPAETIALQRSGLSQFDLSFVDGNGKTVKVPVAYTSGTQLKLGDNNDDLIIRERDVISRNDYFILTDQNTAKSFVMRYSGSSATSDSSPVMRFQNVGSGETIDRPIYTTGPISSIVIGGSTFAVFNASLSTSADFLIRVDLNGNKQIDYSLDLIVPIMTNFGARINLAYDASMIDVESAYESISVTDASPPPSPSDFEFSISASNGVLNANYQSDLKLLSLNGEHYVSKALNSYGAWIKYYNPTNPLDINLVFDIRYPKSRAYPLVYIATPTAVIEVPPEYEAPPETVCTDSDSGLDYYTKGSVTVCNIGNNYGVCSGVPDSCGEDNVELVEWVCENNERQGKQFTCPNGCSDGACIKEEVPPIPEPPEEVYSHTITLQEGWNLFGSSLITGDLDVTETSCDDDNDVLAAYIYDPVNRKYFAVGAEPDISGYLMLSKLNSFWIKMGSSCAVDFEIDRPYGWLAEVQENNRKLANGWNLLSVVPDMVGNTLDDFSGTCNIQHAFGWNPVDKTWERIRDMEFTYDLVSLGFIVKTSGECVLSTPNSLPSGGSGGGGGGSVSQ